MTDFDLRKRANLKDSKVDAIGGNTTLVFPIDMEKKYYPEAIKFSIYERGGVSYDEVREIVSNAFESSKEIFEIGKEAVLGDGEVKTSKGDDNKDAPSNEVSAEFNAIGNGSSGSADFVSNNNQRKSLSNEQKRKNAENSIKNQVSETIRKGQESQSLEKTIERHRRSIYLQMPDSVSFAEAVEWAGTDMGVMGAFKSGMSGTESLEYGVMGNLGTMIGTAAGGVASVLPGIDGIASSVIGAALGEGSGLQAGINNALNVKTNPFKEQTFQGIGFRPFEFSFVFRPRNYPESQQVDEIVRTFRSYSKPTFHDTTKAGFFKYPHEFRIEFLTIDENNSYVTNEYIPEIKFCICNSVNVNFSPNGWRSFEDGAPQTLELQLSFQETELITGEDVLGNTEVGRFKGYGGRF